MQYNQYMIIGAGISGLSVARMLHEKGKDYFILEKSDRPGGLVKCDVVDGHLFHRVGGHVFNTKIPSVGEWFWSHFNKEKEFLQTKRLAAIKIEEKLVGYPIENFIYLLPEEMSRRIYRELITLSSKEKRDLPGYDNFEAFLKGNFGETLYQIYFEPFNQKVWKTDLSKISLPWLEGKLPMPDYLEIIMSNLLRKEEANMVHSSFFYPHHNGSQFIADRLAENLNLQTGVNVETIEHKADQWIVNEVYASEQLIYTGDIRRLSGMTRNINNDIKLRLENLRDLLSNGTSNLLCESDDTPLTWLYLPDNETPAHRIIFTGNLSPTNSPPVGRRSCTIEFSGETNLSVMKKSLPKLPFHLKYIDDNYEPDSYVIQRKTDRERIGIVKDLLRNLNFHLVGRFAEWEYHNMDKAMESAMKVLNSIKS